MKKFTLMVASLILLAGGAILPAATPGYSVKDLGTLGGSASRALAINASGKVVGYSFTPASSLFSHATLFSGTGKNNTDLGTLGGDESMAEGISSTGKIVGSAMGPDSLFYPTLFSGKGTGNINLGTLPGGYGDFAGVTGINAGDKIVGYSPTSGASDSHATLFSGTGSNNIDLGTLPGATLGSVAAAINDSGLIVGDSYTSSGVAHATTFSSGGAPSDIGALWSGGGASARAVSSSGLIVGEGDIDGHTTDGYYHAAQFDAGGNTDLGTLGGLQSVATGVNDAGQIVGYSGTTNNVAQHAFLYTKAGGMVDLNTLIDPASNCTIIDAVGIDDAGQIAANGTNGDGQARAFLLTPMGVSPEDYTAIIPPPGDQTLPQGDGELIMTVKKTGKVTLTGKLGDGTVLTVSAKQVSGVITINQKLYKKKGSLAGTLTLENKAGTDVDGTLTWSKPATAKGLYPAGFTTSVSFAGALFKKPALPAASYPFTLAGGGLATPIMHTLAVSAKGAITVSDPGADKLKIVLNKNTGIFSGNFLLPGARKKTAFTGVIEQKLGYGAGVFLGASSSGSAVFGLVPQ